MIDELAPLLEPGDILIDGGNTHYPDTTRRTKALKAKGLLFIGTGVSGGEEGALKGPSDHARRRPRRPGRTSSRSSRRSPPRSDPTATPCCDWVGPEGAGHYVKMVHNGIEYGDMQLICEAYQLLKDAARPDAPTSCTTSSPTGTRACSTAT